MTNSFLLFYSNHQIQQIVLRKQKKNEQNKETRAEHLMFQWKIFVAKETIM